MSILTVITPRAPDKTKALDVRVILAFLAIYVLWGTTFFAIRVLVLEVPPLFAAGARFSVAGIALYAFMRVKGQPRPTAAQMRSLIWMGLLMFVAEYGPVFWAEKYVASGIVSVLGATLPLITMALEALLVRQQRVSRGMIVSIILGFCGIAVLLLPSHGLHLPIVPSLAVLGGTTCWSLGSVLSRKMDLPASRPLTAGAAMMLGGLSLFVLSGLFGELHPWPHVSLRAGLALLYLIVFGSLIAFTAFIWLLARMPATRVASHAYVNPIVAVAIGYFAGGEGLTARTVCGTVLVIAGVFLLLRQARPPA